MGLDAKKDNKSTPRKTQHNPVKNGFGGARQPPHLRPTRQGYVRKSPAVTEHTTTQAVDATQNSKPKTQNPKLHSDAVRISGEAICHSLPVDKTTDLCT